MGWRLCRGFPTRLREQEKVLTRNACYLLRTDITQKYLVYVSNAWLKVHLSCDLTLFRRGGGDMPAQTLTFLTFCFNVEVKAAKHFNCTYNLSGNNLVWPVIDHGLFCYHGNQISTGMFFSEFGFFLYFKEENNFYLFRSIQHSFVGFDYFGVIFGAFLTFWRKKKKNPRWRLFESSHVAYVNRNVFGRNGAGGRG